MPNLSPRWVQLLVHEQIPSACSSGDWLRISARQGENTRLLLRNVSLLQDGQHLPCAAAVAARRCSCVVLAPTSPSLSAWETLIPLVVSSHVLLDIKTFPVKNHFRLLLYWLMQLLTNKICMDCVLMASFACFNRFSLLWLSFLILFSSFQLAEDKHSGWVASYRVSALPGRRWRTPITTVKCCMAIQTQLFSPFGDEHVSIEQRVRSEGVHRNLLTCGWLPSSLRIPTARLQSSWCYCQEICKQKGTLPLSWSIRLIVQKATQIDPCYLAIKGAICYMYRHSALLTKITSVYIFLNHSIYCVGSQSIRTLSYRIVT